MIEIWPAGPPKLIKPSFNQYTKASPKLTGGGGKPAGLADGKGD